MDIYTGKSESQPGAVSMSYTESCRRRILNSLQNGEITKEKTGTLYLVKIQLTSYDADSENLEKTKQEYYEKLCSNLTEGLLSFMIQKETQVNPFFADTYTNIISGFMSRQLSEIHKELSNTLPVAIEDKELSLLIFHAAANGLMNYMRGSKQSRMEWFTTPDTVQRCGTSGE